MCCSIPAAHSHRLQYYNANKGGNCVLQHPGGPLTPARRRRVPTQGGPGHPALHTTFLLRRQTHHLQAAGSVHAASLGPGGRCYEVEGWFGYTVHSKCSFTLTTSAVVFRPPPFKEWWRGINFPKTASIPFIFGMLLYYIITFSGGIPFLVLKLDIFIPVIL